MVFAAPARDSVSRKNVVRAAFVLATGMFIAGCAGETPSSGPANGSSGEAGSATAAEAISGPAESTDSGTTTAEVPDGNTEPPLPDVASAVDSLPSADKSASAAADDEVSLKVVTPEQFQAAVDQHRGKVVFVDFWATWCVPCRKAFPHTVEMAKAHPEKLAVISMCFDDPESREDVLKFLKEQHATFDNLMCSFGGGDESFSAYEIGDAGLPYFRLYDREGKLVQVFKNDVDAGKGVDVAEVHKAVETLVAGE